MASSMKRPWLNEGMTTEIPIGLFVMPCSSSLSSNNPPPDVSSLRRYIFVDPRQVADVFRHAVLLANLQRSAFGASSPLLGRLYPTDHLLGDIVRRHWIEEQAGITTHQFRQRSHVGAHCGTTEKLGLDH